MSVTTRVSYIDGSVAPEVQRSRYIHAEFAHERFVFRVPNEDGKGVRFKTGTPIQIDWGVLPNAMRTFYGYVRFTKPEYAVDSDEEYDRYLQVVCVGCSNPMTQGGFTTLRASSPSVAFRRAAETFRFDSTYIGTHPFKMAAIAQAGKSWWEWLSSTAKKVGWSFFTYNTRMFFQDRAAVLANTRNGVRVLSPRESGGEILRMKSNIGTATPDGGVLANRVAYSIDPRTGRTIQVTNRANTQRPLFGAEPMVPFYTEGVDISFENLGEGAHLLAGMEGTNRLSVTAVIEAASDPRVRVGTAIGVTGMPNSSDNGLWYVMGVEHEMLNARDAVMTLAVGRDSVEGSNVMTALPPTAAWPVGRGSRLVNGLWVLA